jgi:DNA-binding response OmpR family regulator
MHQVRILFVDDEQSIFLTLPHILRQHGYEVTAVGTVNDALTQITSAQFDVLISDLNIGHPGDGFTVVSAMRRTQPMCITLILTGYPGFDSALEAIRSQVDDYLIKPAVIPSLINLIEQKLQNPRSGTGAATKRISQVLRENTFEITQRSLSEMKSDPALAAIPITDEQRIEHTARTIEELATLLESALESAEPEQARDFIEGAAMCGARRYQLGYTIPLLTAHVRLLEHAIYDVIHEHLRSLNLSYFMFDLKRLNDSLGLHLEHTQIAYLKAEQRIEHKTGQHH